MASENQFKIDVLKGLALPFKKLSSKYFYDDIGDQIFQEIMHMEAYYLPNCELDILMNRSEEIIKSFPFDAYHVIELGAGDGSKTLNLLKQIVNLGKDISYYALDISSHVLDTNESNIHQEIPDLDVHKVVGDYFRTLDSMHDNAPKMLLFLGSNIGNYPNNKAVEFLQLVGEKMQKDDILLVGIDLRKNPKTILGAYNDEAGVTKRFNLNLLTRINRELGANFDLDAYDHYAHYDPVKGVCYSFIVSLQDQLVTIDGVSFAFAKNELIHTEVSQKYSLKEVEELAKQSYFSETEHFLDSKGYYTISSFKK